MKRHFVTIIFAISKNACTTTAKRPTMEHGVIYREIKKIHTEQNKKKDKT